MYKRILTVQDLSCLGHCSGAVALPVLSAWGHETCLLPTALLSTHTGFPNPYICHLTDAAPKIADHWRGQGIRFDGILTGYLGSRADIQNVCSLMDLVGIRIVDPAMADHGRLYRGLDENYVEAMRTLCHKADILLPNVTEAAILTGQSVPETMTEEKAARLLKALPNERAVLTGAIQEPNLTGIAVKDGKSITFYRHEKVPGAYSGTGDLYAACFVGALLRGDSLLDAAAFAAAFTGDCVRETVKDPARCYGIKFEPLLWKIMKKAGEWQ